METEGCPICWREYSTEVVPVCLGCGHSCCQDCSAEIRSCSLCRFRISTNFPRRPNYAMVTMIERMASRQRIERSEQGTQTDSTVLSELPKGRARQTRPGLLEGKAMTVAIKRSAIELIFK